MTQAPAFHEWAFSDEDGFYSLEVRAGLWTAEFATRWGYEDPDVEPMEIYLLPGESVTLDPVTVRRRVHDVMVFDDRIEPREITVGAGAIIRWTSAMPGIHNVGSTPQGDYW